jgi:hypothetical protein
MLQRRVNVTFKTKRRFQCLLEGYQWLSYELFSDGKKQGFNVPYISRFVAHSDEQFVENKICLFNGMCNKQKNISYTVSN